MVAISGPKQLACKRAALVQRECESAVALVSSWADKNRAKMEQCCRKHYSGHQRAPVDLHLARPPSQLA